MVRPRRAGQLTAWAGSDNPDQTQEDGLVGVVAVVPGDIGLVVSSLITHIDHGRAPLATTEGLEPSWTTMKSHGLNRHCRKRNPGPS